MQNIERRIKDWQKRQAAWRKISEIHGIGMLTATVLVATVGGRLLQVRWEFAAFMDLVPRQSSMDGKVKAFRQKPTSDTYLRILLILKAAAFLRLLLLQLVSFIKSEQLRIDVNILTWRNNTGSRVNFAGPTNYFTSADVYCRRFAKLHSMARNGYYYNCFLVRGSREER